ncbi:hypothetical protein Cgig2_019641 [Carnegiea gigantea]|uniref:BZIP domain-containing protein n=1 Tax=Carnegiea gigantea TaxID=171969 RepID=A0A9Q1KHM6_9CARY|nr:hypothetical protein Cgig2_019641 [Carnegiea gigantea]
MALSTSSSMSSKQQEDRHDDHMMTTKAMIRKSKRMISNRESARRSRMRKRMQMDGLMAMVTRLRNMNGQMKASLSTTIMLRMDVEAENSILRAQLIELTNRLHSLNDIILSFGLCVPATDSDQEEISFGNCFHLDVDYDHNGLSSSMNPLFNCAFGVKYDSTI